VSEDHQLIEGLKKLRYDLTGMQVKVSELLRLAASLDLPEPAQRECPKCKATFRGPLSLSEHDYLSHDGPLPAHWARAEAMADEAS
jgi:hypothetical protein